MQRLDFAEITLDIDRQLVEKPLLIIFKATNFSSSQGADCELVYIEVEFRSLDTQYQCPAPRAQTLIEDERRLRKLYQNQPEVFESLNHRFTGDQFYWKDFYIADSQSDLLITLDQKFMDPTTYLPLVEILAEDTSYYDFSYQKRKTNDEEPECASSCEFIGQKTYNRFT